MKIRQAIPFVFGLILVALGNGCATKALWENGNLEAWKEPAPDPHLRLFVSKHPADVLVVYDEYSERNDATHIRAYWLKQNQSLIDGRRAPRFVDPGCAASCTVIPLFVASTNEIHLPPPYALMATNHQSFTLHLSNRADESHDLPFYNDQKGKVEKLALMPLANVADLTILGGILGYVYLQGLAQSEASYSWKP